MGKRWILAWLVACLLPLSLGVGDLRAQDYEKFRQKLEKNLAKKTTPLFDHSTVKALCVCHDAGAQWQVVMLQHELKADAGMSYYKVYCMVVQGHDSSPPWTGLTMFPCTVWSPLPDR